MSDGPHKSLPFNKAWKMAAERADKAAYEPSDVGESVKEAVLIDCRDQMPASVVKWLRKLAGDGQQELFPGALMEEVRQARREVANCAAAVRIVDYVGEALSAGCWTQPQILEAIADGMRGSACAGIVQIEEIYRQSRESSFRHAAGVRRRLLEGVAHASFESCAKDLLGLKASTFAGRTKTSGIDDGPRLLRTDRDHD